MFQEINTHKVTLLTHEFKNSPHKPLMVKTDIHNPKLVMKTNCIAIHILANKKFYLKRKHSHSTANTLLINTVYSKNNATISGQRHIG